MCPPSPQGHAQAKQPPKKLLRMNSFHVGPVKLPHPVRMPNGRLVNRNSNGRASSEDCSLGPSQLPNHRISEAATSTVSRRSLSLKHGRFLEDEITVMEGASQPPPAAKVTTVPLYRPKRAHDARMASLDSCHIAIEEMAGKASFRGTINRVWHTLGDSSILVTRMRLQDVPHHRRVCFLEFASF